MRRYQFMALWMSMLIIMLPLYVSSVFAQSDVINVLSIEGGDGIDNIRRTEQDSTKVQAEVFSAKPLTAQNIQLKSTAPGAAGATFDTCTGISPYLCTWESSVSDIPSGAYSFNTCIGPCDNCYQSSCKKTATIYADGVPPTVELFTADRTSTGGGEIKLHYKLEDRACLSARCSGKCSGLDKFELYDTGDDEEKIVDTVSLEAESCTLEGDYTFTASGMSNGERKLCLVPYDKFGHSMSVNTAGIGCIEIKKDDNMPNFDDVKLLDSTGSFDISYVGGTGTLAKLMINLSVSPLFDLLDRQLKADLSQIGGSSKDSIPCNDLGNGLWSCEKTINLGVTTSGAKDIRLSAVDEGGNNNTQTFTFTLNEDSAVPVVDKITTRHELDGAAYLKEGFNRIYAEISETGSGFSQNKVYFGVGSTNQAVCTPGWTCTANLTVGTGTELITVHGEDDAGNMFSEAKSLVVDSSHPSIKKVIVRNTNGNPFFVTDDDALVQAVLKDNKAIADDSGQYDVVLTPEGFADPNPMQAESCSEKDIPGLGEVFVCEWTLLNLAPGKMKMKLNISDFAGNRIEKTQARFAIQYLEPATGNQTLLPDGLVEIYEVEGKEADYWDSSAGLPMPSFVDSATTELIEHDVWIPVRLTQRGAASLFSVELSGCTGEDYSNYAKEAILVRPSPRSVNPFVRISLNRGAIDKPQLDFECALNIVSKHNDKISQVETETFTGTVPVVSHGEFSSRVVQEISRVSRGWLVKASWIGSIGKIISLFTRICGLIQTISTAIRDIVGLTGAMVSFCEPNPFCNPYAKAGRVSVSGIKNGEGTFWGITYKFCSYVQCRKTLWGKSFLGDPDAEPGSNERLGLSGRMESAVNKKLQASDSGKSTAKGYLFGTSPSKIGSEAERKELGLQAGGILGPLQAWGNPQNSLIMSLATGCIPGVFMNLQKARQIECQYLSCIINDVPAGMPLAACSKVRNFQWCMFVFGEIFQIVPFIGSIKSILAPLIGLFRDPLTLIFGLSGLYCEHWASDSAVVGCHFLNSVNSVLRIINTLKEIAKAKDLFKLGGADSCKETLAKANEIVSKSLQQQERGTGVV